MRIGEDGALWDPVFYAMILSNVSLHFQRPLVFAICFNT